MEFEFSEKVQGLKRMRVQAFMDAHVHPNEATYNGTD